MIFTGCKDQEKVKQEAISRQIRSGRNITESKPKSWVFGESSNEKN